MVFFEWHDTYLINIERLDEHHKKLVALINNLYDDVFRDPSSIQKQPLIKQALAELIDYSYYHFAAEEELMLKYKYPGYTLHKEEHEQFKLQVKQMMEKHEDGKLFVILPIMIFLKDWLILHVTSTDQQYGPYLNEKNIDKF